MSSAAPRKIGNRLAPARFIAFLLLFAIAAPAAVGRLGDWPIGTMLGFDIAALVFLVSCAWLLRVGTAAAMRQHARENDANRVLMLVISLAVIGTVLAAIAAEVIGGAQLSGWTKGLIVATLIIAWLFSNGIYALHYAHIFYMRETPSGIAFPGTKEPVYEDFIYFAFTLGMTFQTSDVAITDARIRRVVTWHCFAAFVFNLGVLAFTINVLGG